VLLTSHYMADVQALCRRVVVIHRGRVLFDGELAALAVSFGSTKTIAVRFAAADVPLDALRVHGEVERDADEPDLVRLRVSREAAPGVTAAILRDHAVADLTIIDPPIDEVIDRVFAEGAADGAAEA
jgi:ABC-2 type transport system ATP-binding protein